MPATFAAKYGPWAVVAGASEGLGAAFAGALAARGVNLLLLARRGDALGDVAQRLRQNNKIEARAEVCDMARPDLPAALAALTADIEVGLGVYNAAFAPAGDLAQRPLDDLLQVADVNVKGPLIFARTLAPARPAGQAAQPDSPPARCAAIRSYGAARPPRYRRSQAIS